MLEGGLGTALRRVRQTRVCLCPVVGLDMSFIVGKQKTCQTCAAGCVRLYRSVGKFHFRFPATKSVPSRPQPAHASVGYAGALL